MRSARLFPVALLGAALLAGCTAPGGAPPADATEAAGEPHLSLDEAKALAAEKGVPVLVDFYSPT